MKIKSCPKTVSGKHMWEDQFEGYDFWVYDPVVKSLDNGVPTILTKCRACGLIDDTKKGKK